ncbi:acetolactate synthase large subunit, partial [Halogeometricum sp. CBA1124]|nr:acetolactate synthase large subunit [Halogeometricum sp. CBA1124]
MSESAPPKPDDEEAADEPTPVTTGAASVVRALENAGAEAPRRAGRGRSMPVDDALYDSGIRHVTMAHEQGAAHAA